MITDSLNKLKEIKSDIKDAIINQGVEVGDKFEEYAEAISQIEGDGKFVVPEGMMFGYSKLTSFPEEIDWSGSKNWKSCQNLFGSCSSLTDAPALVLSKVTNMSSTFSNCSSLKVVDVSGWDTSNVTNFSSTFSACSKLFSLGEIDASANTNGNTQFASPLYNCASIKYFGGFKGWKIDLYLTACAILSYESVLNVINNLADGVSGKTLYLSQTCVDMLDDEDIEIAINKGWSISPAKSISEKIVVLNPNEVSTVQVLSSRTYDFSQCIFDNYIGGSTSNTNFSPSLKAFEGDASSSTNIRNLFAGCRSLISVELSGTQNITNMCRTFENCTSLIEIIMSGDASKVTETTDMFKWVTTNGTFYYNPDYDYSKIIAALPSTWTAVPLK